MTSPLTTAGQKLYHDTELNGFGLRVGTKTKTFFLRHKVLGRRVETCTIGQYDGSPSGWTLDRARKRASAMRVEMDRGISQVEARHKQPERALTLGEAWALHHQEMAKDKPSPKTLRRYQGMMKLYLADWMARPLATITRVEVRKRHQKIRDDIAAGCHASVLKHPQLYGKRKGAKVTPHNRKGESTANDTVRLLRAVWNTALRENDKGRLPANPARDFRGYKLERHDIRARVADLMANLKAWHSGVMAVTPTARRDALLFMLYSGMRKEAATAVRWDDIDLAQRTLFVPRPKGGQEKAFHLPLSDYLIDLLERRRQEHTDYWGDSPWVFPAESASGHMHEARAEIDVPYVPHDLRRVFASVAAKLKVHPYALKQLLNHSLGKGDVTMGYVELDVEDLRGAMQQITDRLRFMCGDDEASRKNVVSMAMRQRV